MSENKQVPDPRFNHYQPYTENGKIIGFTLTNNNFIFRYDEKGGWFDENKRYFNKDGVFQYIQEQWDDQVEEEMVKEMQQLIKQDEGDSDEQQQPVFINGSLDDKIFSIVNRISQGKVKNSMKNKKLLIFIRSKTNNEIVFDKKKVTGYSVDKINESIRAQLEIIRQDKKKFEMSLPQPSNIEFSVSEDKRYWFGQVQASPENFKIKYDKIKSNPCFGILKKKTLLQLAHFLPSQNEKTVEQLRNKLETFPKQNTVKITFKNIAEKIPLSYIIDLLNQVDITEQQYNKILIQKDSADIYTNFQGALKIINLEGYYVEEDTQIELVLESIQEKFVNGNYFIVSTQHPSNPTEIIHQELLLETSAETVAKIDLKKDKKDIITNALIYVTNQSLKRLIMYRNKFINPTSLTKNIQ